MVHGSVPAVIEDLHWWTITLVLLVGNHPAPALTVSPDLAAPLTPVSIVAYAIAPAPTPTPAFAPYPAPNSARAFTPALFYAPALVPASVPAPAPASGANVDQNTCQCPPGYQALPHRNYQIHTLCKSSGVVLNLKPYILVKLFSGFQFARSSCYCSDGSKADWSR